MVLTMASLCTGDYVAHVYAGSRGPIYMQESAIIDTVDGSESSVTSQVTENPISYIVKRYISALV